MNTLGRLAYFLAWPLLYVYLRVGSRTRVAIIAEEKLLLARGWLDDGRYGLPGGGLHRQELPVSGAFREVKEETGIVLDPKKLVYVRRERLSDQGLSFTCHFFVCRLKQIPAVKAQPFEIADLKWVPLDALQTIAHKGEVDRIIQLLAGR